MISTTERPDAPAALRLAPEQLHVLQHSLGVDKYGQGRQYRNYYNASANPTCESLVASGLMVRYPAQWCTGEFNYVVTDAGKREMRKQSPAPPKLSRSKLRYRRYLEVGSCFESFRAFLKYESIREKEAA